MAAASRALRAFGLFALYAGVLAAGWAVAAEAGAAAVLAAEARRSRFVTARDGAARRHPSTAPARLGIPVPAPPPASRRGAARPVAFGTRSGGTTEVAA